MQFLKHQKTNNTHGWAERSTTLSYKIYFPISFSRALMTQRDSRAKLPVCSSYTFLCGRVPHQSNSLEPARPIIHFSSEFASHSCSGWIHSQCSFAGLKPSQPITAVSLVWGGLQAMTHWGTSTQLIHVLVLSGSVQPTRAPLCLWLALCLSIYVQRQFCLIWHQNVMQTQRHQTNQSVFELGISLAVLGYQNTRLKWKQNFFFFQIKGKVTQIQISLQWPLICSQLKTHKGQSTGL